MSSDDYSPSIARLLSHLVSKRSGFLPHLPERMIKITVIKVRPKIKEHVDGGIMDKIAAAYSEYRKSLRTMPKELDIVINRDIGYYNENFFGEMVLDGFTKTASFYKAESNNSIVSAYLFNAYYDTIESVPKFWSDSLPTTSPARALLGPA
jgi:hypothetical protein